MDTFRAYLCLGKQVCPGQARGSPGAGYPSGDTCTDRADLGVRSDDVSSEGPKSTHIFGLAIYGNVPELESSRYAPICSTLCSGYVRKCPLRLKAVIRTHGARQVPLGKSFS